MRPHNTTAPDVKIPVGELPTALPANAEPTDHAPTGTTARVVLGARRQQVRDLYERYIQALVDRDTEVLREQFDPTVIDLERGRIRSREEVVAEHERIIAQLDASQLLSATRGARVLVRSAAQLLRSRDPLPATLRSVLRPGDWLIDRPAAERAVVPSLPRRLLVRWVANAPRIVGIWPFSELR